MSCLRSHVAASVGEEQPAVAENMLHIDRGSYPMQGRVSYKQEVR